jgi:hypothetical protein
LFALARERHEDFQFVLGRWVIERFLYRLSISPHKNQFVLKGAMLFIAWSGKLHRPTRDIDLLGWGSSEIPEVVETIRAICKLPAEDGLEFGLEGIQGERIREDGGYEGVRVRVPVTLDGARVQLQVDIGFGDAVEPAPEERTFPVLLPLEAPTVRTYPPEAVIAEKLEAMVVLGIANSRMKDFYDIWTLASSYTFQLDTLGHSVRTTFARRHTPLPVGLPFALTGDFLRDSVKQQQWQGFIRRLNAGDQHPALEQVGAFLVGFLEPVIETAAGKMEEGRSWVAPGPWRKPGG